MKGTSKMRGKTFQNYTWQTRQLPCLIELYNLFYDSKNNIKIIRPLLYDYMDYRVLAFWIMGDGAKRNQGITLCSDNLTLQEVVLLINILILKFYINPTIHQEKGKFRIYINKKDLEKIRPRILPHFHTHFLYKIN